MRLASLTVACFALPAFAQSVEESYQLLPSDPSGGTAFGVAVAVNPLRQLIGAPSSNVAGELSGAAYVYDTLSGRLLHSLVPEGKRAGARFGSAVDLGPGRAIVGAPTDDGEAPRSGSASIYDLTTGALQFRFTRSGGASDELLGSAVAIDGRFAAIGAPGVDGSGACYVLDVFSGALVHVLRPEDGAEGDEFGGSVALSGSRLVVGSRAADPRGPDSGAAYVFDLESGHQLALLVPSDGEAFDGFGSDVAIQGERVLVGAPYDGDEGEDSGSAYVFDAMDGAQIAKLRGSGTRAEDGFGAAVALDGELALVGAPRADPSGKSSGTAYVFSTNTGVELGRLAPTTASAQSEFGSAVALHGQFAVVGAWQAPGRGGDAGTSYFFELQSLTPSGSGSCYAYEVRCPCRSSASTSEGCPNSTGSGATLTGSGSSSLATGDFRLIGHGLPRGATSLLLRGSERMRGGASRPFGDGVLCLTGDVVQAQVVRASSVGAVTVPCAPASLAALSLSQGSSLAHYQLWYRDDGSSCTRNGLNSTNVWSLRWRP